MTSAPVRVGPPTVTINRDDRVMVTHPDGTITPRADLGFFARDTRFISSYEIALSGEAPVLLNSAPVRFFSARYEFSNPPLRDTDGVIPRDTIALRLDRTMDDGVHEDYDIVNYGTRPVALSLELRIDSDFADVFEVKDHVYIRRGRIDSRWLRTRGQLRTTYVNASFRRELLIRVDRPSTVAQFANGRLVFDFQLAPKDVWHTCIKLLPLTRSSRRPQTLACNALTADVVDAEGSRLPAVDLATPNVVVNSAWRQSVRDMEALRLEDPEAEPGVFVPAAGIPWFLTLFGRDSLITGMYSITGFPELAAGALRRLAALQATADDPGRDMEPGKILHEMRYGELAQLGISPHSPYYGSHDATPLFLITLSYLYHWTGDIGVVERYADNIDACLDWIATAGDRDRDGFQEYKTRSKRGYYNQAWKDAGDAVAHADGTIAPLPLAVCELQGYVFAAKLRTAEMLEALGRADQARRLRRQARKLFERFNDAFWWESEGTYYIALDGDKRPVESVASNPGHLLQSGIVPVERAGRLVERLMRDDMWSGWGVRTLSSDHVLYNPFSYHNGSVWPHDNAMLAGGLRRYGYVREAARVAHALFEAAGHFEATRLPELFAGLPREIGSFPVQFPGANVPQAWAAASIFRLVAVLSGLEARVADGRPVLYADPVLPSWLPEVRIGSLRLGGAPVGLHLTNEAVTVTANGSKFEVIHGAAPPLPGTPDACVPPAKPVTFPD